MAVRIYYSYWFGARELKPLPTKAIDAFLSDNSKKAGKLREGYTIARDPAEWEAEQARRATEEEEDVEEDVDMLEEDGEEKVNAAGKKRKRAAEPKKKETKKSDTAASKKRKVSVYSLRYCAAQLAYNNQHCSKLAECYRFRYLQTDNKADKAPKEKAAKGAAAATDKGKKGAAASTGADGKANPALPSVYSLTIDIGRVLRGFQDSKRLESHLTKGIPYQRCSPR